VSPRQALAGRRVICAFAGVQAAVSDGVYH